MKFLLLLVLIWGVLFPGELCARLALDPLLESKDGQKDSIAPSHSSKQKEESTWRRGEVVFFLSLPFTAIGSFAAVQGYGSLMGQTNPFPSNTQITAALTFALVTSFVVAWNDYYYKRYCGLETAYGTISEQGDNLRYSRIGKKSLGIRANSITKKEHYWQFGLIWKTF